jgi:hypothetical protein
MYWLVSLPSDSGSFPCRTMAAPRAAVFASKAFSRTLLAAGISYMLPDSANQQLIFRHAPLLARPLARPLALPLALPLGPEIPVAESQ